MWGGVEPSRAYILPVHEVSTKPLSYCTINVEQCAFSKSCFIIG